MGSILPTGESISTTPSRKINYLDTDLLRQMFRQERLRWLLKVNRDCDYYQNTTLHKYTGSVHNEGNYQKMEIRTFPDNAAMHGYAGLNIDSGVFGLVHQVADWDFAMSRISPTIGVNRVQIGATANIPDTDGYGMNDNGEMTSSTSNRSSQMVFDPYDGRAYLLTNDSPYYVNNDSREITKRLPGRTAARICDIPTKITDLENDLDVVSDVDYKHTDNNFTNSNRYVVDNMDDRTFVYPEISKNSSGEYVNNSRMGLSGRNTYGEGDGEELQNSHPDYGTQDNSLYGDRFAEDINSYNKNKTSYSGVVHNEGYFPGVFRSLEELELVDIVGQTQDKKTHKESPGAKRPYLYYIHDGVWSPNWYDRTMYNDSYLAQPLNPMNMEMIYDEREPRPYNDLNKTNEDDITLYQWRYNRISLKYLSSNIVIKINDGGMEYVVGDILRYTFADDVFTFIVTEVGGNGYITRGEYVNETDRVYEQDPSTAGVGIPFSNSTGVGRNALLSIECPVTMSNHAAQIKNNLYAYVDVVPTVRSDNTSEWSDCNYQDDMNGLVKLRSTAAGPAYSGVNSGRGGPPPVSENDVQFYEHGGNPTAGSQVHLFRYVINTENPVWVIHNGIQIFKGDWVDQGPMGVGRPCDIKALLFSNSDCNNFNNYYKFMLDKYFDSIYVSPDAVITGDEDALAPLYIHRDQKDPESNKRFYNKIVSATTGEYETNDITESVLWINSATGITFEYNGGYKNDDNFGYGNRAPGWQPLAGAVTK